MESNSTPRHHSNYGGLWIDRIDWEGLAKARSLTDEMKGALRQFVEDGYIIFEKAAPEEAVDAFQREVERSFREGNPALLYQAHLDNRATMALDRPVDRLGTRIVDSFVAVPAALDLFTSPKLVEFLNLIFGEDPHLFQSLSFDQGSQQGLHQDTAYVVVDRPLELSACWIALEDVKPGSGELMYAPGSHRLPDWHFGGVRKHFDPAVDSPDSHEDWSRHLRAEAARSPKGVQRFLAKKGDILIWHADLAHGGSPVTDPTLTRQSLVGHFCPQSASPHYFSYNPDRRTIGRYGRLTYSSEHYDLAALARASVRAS
jgi:ectoine hydroxylase-related dioxygenase (phytanoyl-CoA dioxygenase family)